MLIEIRELQHSSATAAFLPSPLKIKFEEVLSKNIAKLQKRYPEKYSDHLAAEENRNREEERLILEQQGDVSDEVRFQRHDYNPECAKRGGSEELLPNRAIRVGQGISQTGNGWAEPPEIPEVVILKEVPAELAAHYGDGLVREGRDSSYNMACGVCCKPIHRTNTAGLCPDCAAANRTKLIKTADAFKYVYKDGSSSNEFTL